MSLTPGTRLGPYIVGEPIGAGGMGEVYRARDTRLDRDVALKVLPDLFTSDPERLGRFEREAKVLASLNHPHIAQVYGFEPPAPGSTQAAIAMELVDGHTLQELLDSQPSADSPGLPLERALAIARQIATALDAAHEQGIVHRDLKPANIKVREDGTVKILDFGLAKAFAADAESAQSAVAHSPTFTARSTQLGMILGTAAYMSPEQAKGRIVDRRADVWAFGVVFFEMLAGRRAFEGDDVSDILASVLKTDPDWSVLPADLPAPVRRLLRRCLEKDPKKRLRDIAEGMLQLDEGLASGATTSGAVTAGVAATTPIPWWRRAAPIAGTAIATAVVITAVGMVRRPAPPVPPITVRSVYNPPTPLLSTLLHSDLALSHDGRLLAYTIVTGGTGPAIHLRRLDQLESTLLQGAQPGIAPFFSPDGEWVGFLDQFTGDQIRKVSSLGGPSVPVTQSPSSVLGAAWTSDGIIFGTRDGPLRHVGNGGGHAEAITSLDAAAGETEHIWPSVVPGSSVVLFAAASGTGGSSSIQLAALDRATDQVVRLTLDGSQPRYVATGHIVYAARDGSLRAAGFDVKRMAITGTPVPVLEGVGLKRGGAANFDVSHNGHLVYASGASLAAMRTLAWVDRRGGEIPIGAPPRNYFYTRVSPDGSRLSLDARDHEEDLWVWDLERESMSRLTDTPGSDQYGLWTPDQHVIFSSTAGGRAELFRKRPDGIGQPEQLTDTAAQKLVPFPNAITPDGKQVIFRSVVGTKNDLFLANMTGDKNVRALITSPHDERNAALSPDGAFMAFESDMTGSVEVFVRPFPNVDDGQFPVSTAGGTEPVWSPDGREIFYLSKGKLMAVPVTKTAGRLTLGKPAALFDTGPYFFGGAGRNYDVAPDGRRFAMIKNPPTRGEDRTPITIVLNWIEELRARVK